MRNPHMIDWAITNRCNLNCLYCRGRAARELETKEVLEIARQIPALLPGWVIIEGGEPLLREEIFDVIQIIREAKINVYLITNGMLLDEKIARRLALNDVRLMISIDGTDRQSYEKIRQKASFEKLVKSVSLAKEAGILDSCPVTIGRRNYGEIEKFFEFAHKIGYRKITFLGLKPCQNYEDHVLWPADYEKIFLAIIDCQRKLKIDVFVDEPFFKPFLKERGFDYSADSENGIIVPEISGCIFGEYMFIEADGQVKPCTFASLTVGDAKTKTLGQIWEDMREMELIRKIKDFSTRDGECRSCKYVSECGGCRSRTFALTKSWTGSDPSCPLSLK